MQREESEEGYAGISEEAAEYLVEIGVETVGVDYRSVEPFEGQETHAHDILLGVDVPIMEGLVLTDVGPGILPRVSAAEARELGWLPGAGGPCS